MIFEISVLELVRIAMLPKNQTKMPEGVTFYTLCIPLTVICIELVFH